MGIDLEKKESPVLVSDNVGDTNVRFEEEEEITSESLLETTRIHGWLSFFLFSIIVGGLISAIYPIITFDIEEYWGSYVLGMTDIVSGIMLFALAIYTLMAFCKRKPNAVFLGKTYVVLCFASNFLTLLNGEFDENGLGSFKHVFRGVVWGIVWFAYLLNSNQVEEVIPTEFRRILRRDYYVIPLMIVVPVVFLMWGMLDVHRVIDNKSKNFLTEVKANLKENEYSDGRVIFTRPMGFKCSEKKANDITIFELESESVGNILVCSDFDTDSSIQNVNSYWNNWEDQEIAKYTGSMVENDTRTINGRLCYVKVKRYEMNGKELYWRFIMMFDSGSGKVCLVSVYDGGTEEYLGELLNSIRFSPYHDGNDEEYLDGLMNSVRK